MDPVARNFIIGFIIGHGIGLFLIWLWSKYF